MNTTIQLPDGRVVPADARITLVPKITIAGDRRDEEIKALRHVVAAARRLVNDQWSRIEAVRTEQLDGQGLQDLHGTIRDLELKGFSAA